MKKLTAPLLNQFGITYFARQTVTNDGYWEILGNLPEWLDYSASKEFYNVDPSLLHPDHYQSGLIVNSSNTVPDFLKNMVNECLKKFDIENTLCILEKNPIGSEWYFFASSAKNHKIISTYVTQINSIYKYIKHFKQEAESLIFKNLEFTIDVANLKNAPFHASPNKIDLLPHAFVDDDILNYHVKNITSREKDCLKYLMAGKTIKETAKLLSLSPRTVEEYLNRLKQKAGCKYKRELIALFQKKPTF